MTVPRRVVALAAALSAAMWTHASIGCGDLGSAVDDASLRARVSAVRLIEIFTGTPR